VTGAGADRKTSDPNGIWRSSAVLSFWTSMATNPNASVFRKVIVTLTTGILTYTLANLVNPDLAFQVGVSIFFSGVVFVVMYLIESEARMRTVELKLDAYADNVRSIASQQDAAARQIRLLIRYVEEQLPRVIGETVNLKQREEPLVRELTHSLNTPLAHLEASLISLPPSPKTTTMLASVRVCKSYMAAFRRVATLARDAEAWQPESLGSMLKQAADLYRVQLGADVAFSIDLPSTIPGYGNNAVLAILLTLLENAIEETPAGSTISVSASMDGETWLLEITNDLHPGHTLDEDIYQRNVTTKPGHEGLGLDAVRNILATQAGTDLSHRCTDDRVTFIVRLPGRRA
jgi:signal transduction histidine kinase